MSKVFGLVGSIASGKGALADYTITNEGTIDDLMEGLRKVFRDLYREDRKKGKERN